MPTSVRAESANTAMGFDHVVISEINWAGSPASIADEWIELYNPTSQSVDLGGWILTNSATAGSSITFPETLMIEPNTMFLIANYDIENEKTTLNTAPDFVDTALSLPNSGLDIMLMNTNGDVVDHVDEQLGSSSPITSMERDLVSGTWFTSVTQKNLLDANQYGTPGFVHTVSGTHTNADDDAEPYVKDVQIVYMPCTAHRGPDGITVTIAEETDITSEETVELTNVSEDDESSAVAIEHSDDDQNINAETTNTEDLTVVENDETSEDVGGNQLTDDTEAEQAIPYAAGDILITEFVSNPDEGEQEWVELYNATNDEIDLSDWTLTDASERETPLEGTVRAKAYTVVYAPKGKLNNGGDDVYLYHQSTLIDSVTYTSEQAPNKGESLALNEDSDWVTTPLMTPGSENQFAQNTTEDDVDSGVTVALHQPIQDEDEDMQSTVYVEDESDKTAVQEHMSQENTTQNSSEEMSNYTGAVTAEPGLFGKQLAFIDGIQLYFYHANWPELRVGDVIAVNGIPSVSRGENRVKIQSPEDITVLRSEEVVPYTGSIADVLEHAYEGQLVEVEADVINREGDVLTLADESGELQVYIHQNTGIAASSMQDALRVTGIIRLVSDEVRLYPRGTFDVHPVETEDEETANAPVEMSMGTSEPTNIARAQSATPFIGGGILLTTGSTLGYWFLRTKNT